MVKAVYCRDFSDIRTCQNPDFRSILEKNWAPTMDSMVSCIRGRGNESFLVLVFSFRKLMQNRRVPSFFLTRTMALHQGDFKGQIAPPSNMSCRFSRTSSSRGGVIRRNLSLNGSSSISSMMCSTVYLGRRYGDAPLAFVQISEPVPGEGASFPWVSANSLASSGEGTASGTLLATAIWATHLPGAR